MAESNPMALARTSSAFAADIVGRSLLLTLMAFVGQGAWSRASALAPTASLRDFLTFSSEVGAFLFAALVCLLAVIRLPSSRRANGWGATVFALGGAFIMTIVNRLPTTPLPLSVSLLSAGLLAGGNAAAVYCLAHLGRSFSVLPEARRLVQTGPYGVVRHPLYVAEGVATVGLVLLHWSALAVAVGALQMVLQWLRLRQEEKVLLATFPGYADYAASTPRLVPGWRPALSR